MLFILYTISKDDTIVGIYLTLDDSAKTSNDSFGRINICYNIQNSKLQCTKEWNTIDFIFGDVTYIKVNDKDKFVIKTIEDVKKLYTFMSGYDYDKFIAEFNKEDKQNTIDNRKKSFEQDF